MNLSHSNPAASPSPSQGCGGAGALLPPRSAPADLTFGAYSVRNGVLFHGERMFHADPFVMLEIHARDAAAGDYWSLSARRHYLDLYDAMQAAGLIEQEQAA
jgi:hypothetical protein